MAQEPQATVLHADLDAFYASVEQLLDPSLRGKPIAVGGGVVLAASYEAKRFGVEGAMSGWRARQLCPNLIFVGGHFSEYQRLGDAVMDVFRDFTPLVERISIDEAFLDVSGALHLFGAPDEIAAQIRGRVREEIGLPVSIGVATTKHLAKVASQVAKPDGLVMVEPGREREFLAPLPVGLLWGVGPVTKARLAERGILSIGDLAASAPETLEGLLGHGVGAKLGALAANTDPRRIETRRVARSLGAQSAFGRRVVTERLLAVELGFLADRVASRLREHDLAGRTVTVRVRFPRMRSVTRSTTLPEAISTTRALADVSIDLAKTALVDNEDEREITLLATSVSNLVSASAVQMALPMAASGAPARPTAAPDLRIALDHAVDEVRAKFGRAVLGHAAVVFRDAGGVPDEFRELAQADRPVAPSPAGRYGRSPNEHHGEGER